MLYYPSSLLTGRSAIMRTTELRDKDTASLRKKKSQILREMPDLGGVMRGSLIERFLRCGKANCKCQVGRGHGPKCYVSISHPKGRPEMLYVPKAWNSERGRDPGCPGPPAQIRT